MSSRCCCFLLFLKLPSIFCYFRLAFCLRSFVPSLSPSHFLRTHPPCPPSSVSFVFSLFFTHLFFIAFSFSLYFSIYPFHLLSSFDLSFCVCVFFLTMSSALSCHFFLSSFLFLPLFLYSAVILICISPCDTIFYQLPCIGQRCQSCFSPFLTTVLLPSFFIPFLMLFYLLSSLSLSFFLSFYL